MELKTLKSFIAVADLQNFSAAARQLHTVQPAISRHIATLEEELGVALFVRNSREVHITAAGQQLLLDAKDLIKRAELAKSQALRSAKGEIGELRIAYLGSACLSFMAGLVRAYKQRHPAVKVSLFEMTAAQQVLAFQQEQIDLGFSRPLPAEFSQQFVTETIYQDKLVAVLPEDHCLAKEKSLSVKQLAREPFALFKRSEAVGLFDGIIALCQKAEFSPTIVSQPNHMQTLLTEVASGLGVSLVPYCIAKLHSEHCVFVPIRDNTQPIYLQLHYPAMATKPTVNAFVELALASLTEIQASMP
ncbi:LysR family transcriptional regulator [Agarivorans aestuarii]|uniref:LysR family transcriptional regulator n=1 Tax=Agarivorans aestuarii TaxID=1563703 RepID=A0ABU7G300_9ALTE|nr:LysR family transcriptional regulator [Agarivorans aestuarii]MEE1673767.1 LysR family transcriptional regulator [Agarivorans aestuarii]